jgi:membrane associated rhomboid family serine protease
MIPISDNNPTRLAPLVTLALIIACVGIYLWERSLGRDMEAALAVFGFTPASLFASYGPFPGASMVPASVTIFTAMFLHGGILHVGGNMLYLWIFWNNVEDAMGHARFLIFYLVCEVAAALTLAYIDPGSRVPMVGASGAISGVLAAYMLLFPRAVVTVIVPLGIIFLPFKITAVWVVGFWFVLQLFNAAAIHSNQAGIAWWAHVGGFIAGIILTPLLKSSGFPLFDRSRKGPWG